MNELEPCPFCGLHLMRSDFLSNRLREVRTHLYPGGEECILYDVKISMDDHPDSVERRAKWNQRAYSAQLVQLDQLASGSHVPLPVSAAHADAMVRVGSFYLDNLSKDPTDV